VRLLALHPEVELVKAAWIPAEAEKGKKLQEIFPHLTGKVDLACAELDAKKFAKGIDLVFLAIPHKQAMTYVPKFLAVGVKVIDFSADYRIS